MKIYWWEKDIPALKGFSGKDREAAKRAVMPQVWRHWQVWLPWSASFLGMTLLFFYRLAPRDLPLMFLGIFIATRLAALPLHHFLELHLQQNHPNNGSQTPPAPANPDSLL
ncbi:MAG: hypothetical protein V4726_11320 [Verrucomicrobiota bacterium]